MTRPDAGDDLVEMPPDLPVHHRILADSELRTLLVVALCWEDAPAVSDVAAVADYLTGWIGVEHQVRTDVGAYRGPVFQSGHFRPSG